MCISKQKCKTPIIYMDFKYSLKQYLNEVDFDIRIFHNIRYLKNTFVLLSYNSMEYFGTGAKFTILIYSFTLFENEEIKNYKIEDVLYIILLVNYALFCQTVQIITFKTWSQKKLDHFETIRNHTGNNRVSPRAQKKRQGAENRKKALLIFSRAHF